MSTPTGWPLCAGNLGGNKWLSLAQHWKNEEASPQCSKRAMGDQSGRRHNIPEGQAVIMELAKHKTRRAQP